MVSEIYYAVQPVYSYDLVLQMEALFLFSRSLHLVPRLILLFKLSIEFAESTESSLIGAWSLSPDEDVEGEITRDVLPRRRLFKGEGSGGGFTEVGGVRSWLDTVIIHPRTGAWISPSPLPFRLLPFPLSLSSPYLR